MTYGYSQVFLGKDHIGDKAFALEVFSKNTDNVYMNGERLVRSLDYSPTMTSGDYTGISLIGPRFEKGLLVDDVLEVLTDHGSYNETKSIREDLDSIKAATMGSWAWDKVTGVLTMYDTSGLEKFKFKVDDNANSASRERRQDLEVS